MPQFIVDVKLNHEYMQTYKVSHRVRKLSSILDRFIDDAMNGIVGIHRITDKSVHSAHVKFNTKEDTTSLTVNIVTDQDYV